MSNQSVFMHAARRTHATFLRSMRDRLFRETIPADSTGPARRPLAQLRTREPSDPAIALLDAWACVMDVLTFHHERIEDEGHLHTAVTRRSVLELTRAIGYELDPGVAASVWLAFEIDDPPGAVTIPAGSEVLSVPRQDQLPRTFETGAELSAHSAWNRLEPAPPPVIEPPLPDARSQGARFEGTGTGLDVGGVVLLVRSAAVSEEFCLFKVRGVHEDRADHSTSVTWSLIAQGALESQGQPGIFVFRRVASLFGHDAPDRRLVPDTTTGEWQVTTDEWPEFEMQADTVDLERVYPQVAEGGWIVLVNESQEAPSVAPCTVGSVRTVSRTDFTLRSKVTRVGTALATPGPFDLRSTVVHVESAPLTLARVSAPSVIHGASVDLVRTQPEPAPGQVLIFAGEGEAAPGSSRPTRREAAVIQGVGAVEGRSDVMRVVLSDELEGSYAANTLRIHGNVVRATHGKTVREVLGSGDAAQANQRFALRVSPLTHVPEPVTGGIESTLSVRVGDVLWREAPSLHGLGPTDTCYAVRADTAGVASVIFGDGSCGARLPSGQENVVATYRTGSGPAGNVDAGTLILLQTRTLGVRSVTNPIAASGGAAPDDLERARAVAPLGVCTMDRVVSLRDHESLALSFAGIAKASATVLETDHGRVLHLTIAGTGGQAIPRDSALHEALTQALARSGDSTQPFHVAECEVCWAWIQGTIRTDPSHRPEAVSAAVSLALTRAFSFDSRAFGQVLSRSEIVAVIQRVAGVVSVGPIALCEPEADVVDEVTADGVVSVDPIDPCSAECRARSVIVPAQARFEAGELAPAGLVILDIAKSKICIEVVT